MHSNSPGSIQHGPKWFRHYAPTAILLISIAAFLLVFSGSVWNVFFGEVAEHPTPQTPPPTHETGSWPHRARSLTYDVYRELAFHTEEPSGNLLILSGEILVTLIAFLVSCGIIFLLGHKVQLWWYTRDGRHVIICGLGERIGLPLARAYRTTKMKADRRKVIAITWEPDAVHRRHSIESLCDLDGVIVLPGDATSPALLKLANVAGADRIFAVTSDDAKNLEIALAVADCVASPVHPPRCHVHIDDPERASLLIDRLQQLPDLVGTETFCLRHQIIRTLIRGIFTANAPAPGDRVHVVLIGFGKMAQDVARELAAQSHFLNHQRLRLSIADCHIASERDAFLEKFPAFCPAPGSISFDAWDERLDHWDSLANRPGVRPLAEAQTADLDRAKAVPAVEYVCNAEFLEMAESISTGGLIAKIRQRLAQSEIGAVIVCTEDMPRNAEIALALENELNPARSLTVWTWLPKGDAFARLMKSSAEAHAPLVRLMPFGLAEELESPLQLVQAPFEQEARDAHAAYLAQCNADGKCDPTDESMRPWHELPARTRNDNRDQIANSHLKFEALRAVGINTVPSFEAPSGDALPTDQEIEALAELEHNRWMAGKLLHGFRYAPESHKPSLRHQSLVPFAVLPEEEKKKDRSPIRQLLEGRSIRRHRPEPAKQTKA